MSIDQFETPGVNEALLATLLRITLRLWLKPAFSPRWSIAVQRRWLGWVSRLTLVPRGVRYAHTTVAGVPGQWVSATAPRRAGALLYLHGGAYCLGSPATHRALTGRLARATALPVFALDYRLAPEHPFPAALDDALAAARALLAQGPLVIAGDSAGGGLALATALSLRDARAALPAGLLLFSPWVDLAPENAPAREPPGEVMLSTYWAAACAANYVGRHAVTEPLISPLRAELHALPPTLIQAGTDELLHPQALRLHDALQRAGVPVRCETSAHRWHVFQMHGGVLRSADQALERAAGFVAGVLEGGAAAAPSTVPSAHEVVILGAGMSGLCMAIQLKKAGIDDFVILEKSDGVGGTWWDNTYPGAHVDVPAPLYSFSFEPNPEWSRRFASAREIQAYMHHCADKYGIARHIHLGTRIAQARFDAASGHWCIGTERGERLRARFFVCSTGPLSQARFPDVPGLDGFRGQLLHSARWRPNIDVTGQRVAVIGTGSTASQLVSPLAEQAQRLHVFQRTANWVLPRMDRPYTALDRALAHLPPYASLVRAGWYLVLESGRRGFEDGTMARRAMLGAARAHLRRQVADEALRERLRPPYPLGCKRIIYSNDFYPALTQPHVELVTESIARVTPHGIVTADGRERPVDTLVCATGFDTVQLLSSLTVTGIDGLTLRDAWRDGPEAYHGVTVSGFPNLFLLLGPNTGTGHTSTLLYIEPEVRYAIACMQAVKARGLRWIDVRPDVLRTHNERLQARLAGSVWTHCRSWYRMDSGKVVALWPGFTREYVAALRRPNFADYAFG